MLIFGLQDRHGSNDEQTPNLLAIEAALSYVAGVEDLPFAPVVFELLSLAFRGRDAQSVLRVPESRGTPKLFTPLSAEPLL
jgi:hypothetical protein